MFIRNFGLLMSLSLACLPTLAQYPTAISLVQNGANAYIKGDATAAINAWLKGSCLEGNRELLSQANTFHQVEDMYGKPESSDIIAEVPITPRVKIIYLTINFKSGAIFCKFQVYEKQPGGWVSGRFDFNTEASKVLGQTMMEPQK